MKSPSNEDRFTRREGMPDQLYAMRINSIGMAGIYAFLAVGCLGLWGVIAAGRITEIVCSEPIVMGSSFNSRSTPDPDLSG